MLLPNRLVVLLALAVASAACTSESADVASSDADYTSERSATPDVPRYTDADAVPDFGAVMRTSLDGAAFTESPASAATPITQREGLLSFSISGALRVDFGGAFATEILPGTYSCADGDAAVMKVYQRSPTQLGARAAKSCTVVIDEVRPAKGARDVRVYGRFEAASNLPDGLPTSARGAFAGDFPLPRPAAP